MEKKNEKVKEDDKDDQRVDVITNTDFIIAVKIDWIALQQSKLLIIHYLIICKLSI